MGIPRHPGTAAAYQKIKVCSLVRLQDVFDIESLPAALRKRRGRPLGATGYECAVVDLESQMSLGYIEGDDVS
jgi:hypothetical protein